MIKYLKSELYKYIFSKKSLMVFFIIIFIFCLNLYNYIPPNHFNIDYIKTSLNIDSIDIFLFIRRDILAFLTPLLASFVFSDSYLLDSETGFLKFIYLRITKKKYIFSKIVLNCIISGIIYFFAAIIFSVFLIILFKVNVHSSNEITGPFNFIAKQSRVLYLLVVIISTSISNSSLSMLSLAVSPWIKNRYLTVLFSFFYYLLSSTVFPALGLYSLNGTLLYSLHPISSEVSIILYQIALLILSSLLFYWGALKNNEKNI